MNKVHRPHRDSGYIAKVDFQQTADRDGNPDWIMFYVPSPKARAEFKTFTKRGGPTVLEVEPRELPPPEPGSELERELTHRGVTLATAVELANQHTEEKIRAQMERLDWLLEKKPDKIEEPAAYLVQAIKNDFAAPKGFVSKAERQRREEAKQARTREEAEEHRHQHEKQTRERTELEAIDAYLQQLTPAQRIKHEAAAFAQASEEIRQNYQNPAMHRFRESLMLGMLREHVRPLLKHREHSEEPSRNPGRRSLGP